MNKVLSLIVPTYNMEKYLERCLSSLIVGDSSCKLMQSLEVLVINDGSVDSSSLIAHSFEARFPDTFKVIDKKNGHYGSCINAALPLASGKYVKVLDSDDWFDTEVFANYLDWLSGQDVDAVIADYYQVTNEQRSLINVLNAAPYKVLDFNDYYKSLYKMLLHGITYNKRVFEGLQYHQTEGMLYTDTEWMYLPMSRVHSFMVYPKAFYCYMVGRDGQSVNPEVYRKSFHMILEEMFICIGLYESCAKEYGMRNGTPVNMDFLHYSCLSRALKTYSQMIYRENKFYWNYIEQVEERMLKNHPDFYTELDSAKFPFEDDARFYHPRFRIIHTLRKRGKEVAYKQVYRSLRFSEFFGKCNALARKIIHPG